MVFGFFLGQQTESRLLVVSEHIFPAARQSQLAFVAFEEQIKYYDDAVILGESSFIQSAIAKGVSVKQALQDITRLRGISASKREAVAKTLARLNKFNTSAKNLYSKLSLANEELAAIGIEVDVYKEEKIKEKTYALAKEIKILRSELTGYSKEFGDALKTELAEIRFNTRRHRYMNLILFFLVVISALSLIFFIVRRSISRPLEKTFMLESAVEQSGDGIAVSDLSNNIRFVNQAWARMHGYEQHELINKHMDIFHTKEQIDNELIPFYKKVMETGAYKGEVRHKRNNGEIFTSMMTGTVLKDNNEKNVSLVSIAKDITEKIQQENELRKAKEKTEEANKALQESLDLIQRTQNHLVESEKMASLGGLVAGVAHEINTPVGVGLTASSHLEEKTEEFTERFQKGNIRRSELEKYLDIASEASSIILTNLNRAADLIRSFKQVAVDQSGEEHRKFNFKGYINELLISLRPKYKRTGHRIIVNCREEIEIDSYPGVFSQIITNFIMNSLTHGFVDVNEGIIKIDVSTDKGHFFLTYSDNGNGMDEEALKKIFEPFFTTRRSHGGTGLGMHVVYNLVTQTLNGQIICHSEPGGGTTFFLQVPLTRDNDAGVGMEDI